MPTSGRVELLDGGREDDRRKRDEIKLQGLQSQLDELRAVVREQASRQARLEDLLKVSESNVAQQRMVLEQHRHEVSQSAQARHLEEGRVRQQLAELSSRIDDSTRPIRSLQAHVAELLEAVRRQRDDAGHDVKRYDELRVLIDHLAAHGERQIGVSQTLRDSIETVRTEVERLQREILRAEDSIKIVDQEVRRRVAEVAQRIENLAAHVDEEVAAIPGLGERIEELREWTTAIPPQFEELHAALERAADEVGRYRTQAVERDELAAERIEEVREQLDAQVAHLGQLIDQRVERLTARLEQHDDADRELAYRVSLLEMLCDELKQVDGRLRRELWYLHEQRARLRLEQAQSELDATIEARRAAEQRTSGGTKE